MSCQPKENNPLHCHSIDISSVRFYHKRKNALDNLSVGKRENLPEGAELIEMDILDEGLAAKVISGQFDAIVHLAGQTMVNKSIDDPAFDAQQNVLGSIRVLEAARQAGVERVIFASTAAAYGNVPESDLPIKESRKLAPMAFYGLSKVSVEKYLDLYQKLYDLDYVVLRFANVYGERQGDGGEGGGQGPYGEQGCPFRGVCGRLVLRLLPVRRQLDQRKI